MYVLNANHISKSYKAAGETMRILQNMNLQVMKGEMVAIMGPSGSGKTTLLHVLTGVDTPDDGEIVIGGETFSQLTEEEKAFFRRKHMGMIFQDFQLLESLTVKENILLPLILERKEADIQQERFSRIADVLSIEKLADKGITEISGGQKQRVAIGRALINEPDIIFGDEPTGSLDRKTTGDVMRCMKQMNQRSGISFLLVTHDAYTASFCDRVLFLQDGNLAKEVKKENTADNFREDIWKTLCGLGGGKDDLFCYFPKDAESWFLQISIVLSMQFICNGIILLFCSYFHKQDVYECVDCKFINIQ